MPKYSNLILLFLISFFLISLPPSSSLWSQFTPAKSATTSIVGNKILNFPLPPQPIVSSTVVPALNSTNYILIDNPTNLVILSKNPKQLIYPASITKLATAVTALNIYPLDEVVTIDNPSIEGKVMELESGEKITISSLINALLVFSANDAANALASHHLKGQTGFVDQMNQLMTKYHLSNTHFVNVDGIHDPNHYSTVADLSQLARLAIKNPIVAKTVQTKDVEIKSIDGQIVHQLTSTNELLEVVPEIKGLKTGWTPESGGSFIGLIEYDGHQVISVVANSTDRFGDTKILLAWLKSNVTWK